MSNLFNNLGFVSEQSYSQLPNVFFSHQLPIPVSKPELVIFNYELANFLGLDVSGCGTDLLSRVFSGNDILQGFSPLAQAYAGHQFGHLTLLGDGRAILLTEHITSSNQRVDIQLKGSGQTPYSRNGDGRAALGPMLREYLISEAMVALGIPTTRSLAVVKTGDPVYRESVLDGAVLTRVAKSHIRVGTFEFAAIQHDVSLLKTLADYTIRRHYPECLEFSNPYPVFLDSVIRLQAKLVSQWMLVGFVHGVMNTDNVSIAGETLDYGPCAFMDRYDPETVFSSIDRMGRYAYGNQPVVMQWNMARFAETLIPLLDENLELALKIANDSVASFSTLFSEYWISGMKKKLGLYVDVMSDDDLISDFLLVLNDEKLDYTLSFFDICVEDSSLLQNEALRHWHQRWLVRLELEQKSLATIFSEMSKVNPRVIPRNYFVENALNSAISGDFSEFNRFLFVLQNPFERLAHSLHYDGPGDDSGGRYRTFCGT